ncbi:hypothetical protein MHBO_000954 [Bonamia ostreae]|uniref:OBG-type G domain-containing protein n=1 Tax=Bonamia ostreae TaxID=126728 RepID=A0ABV2AIL1_9EUKA
MDRTQKNKATMGHIGLLKARLAKLKRELLLNSSSAGKSGEGFDVSKSGNARVGFVGFPSVGKSTLLTKLTNTVSKAADYEFTTLTCVPGSMVYKGCKIQVSSLTEAARPPGNHRRGQRREGEREAGHRSGPHVRSAAVNLGRGETDADEETDRKRVGRLRDSAKQVSPGHKGDEERKRGVVCDEDGATEQFDRQTNRRNLQRIQSGFGRSRFAVRCLRRRFDRRHRRKQVF